MKNRFELDFPFAYILGITEQEHFWLMFSLGEEYLKAYCGQFLGDLEIFIELPEFWMWFKQLVQQADKCRDSNANIQYVNACLRRPDIEAFYFSLIVSHDSLLLTPNRVVKTAYKAKFKTIQTTQITQTI